MKEMNIPAISVDTMVDRLSSLYITALKGGLPVKAVPAVFLWGAPGVGKSAGVRQIAERIQTWTGKNVHVTDVRLLLFSPIDLRGVPMADASRQFTEWLRPKLFDFDASEDVVNILFLDELSAAPQSVQAAAYQITLDRTVGEHKLPDNTIIIAAGNRTTDRSVAFRMPNALANRMMHFRVEVSFASWKAWADRNGVHPFVKGYLSHDPDKLYAEPADKDEIAYPTPRTWEFISGLLRALEIRPDSDLSPDLNYLFSGCIGSAAALDFELWCNVFRALPSVERIYAGLEKPDRKSLPKKPDVLFALVSTMGDYAFQKKEKLLMSELKNAWEYASCFPVDYTAAFLSTLLEIPGVKLKLGSIESFVRWAKRHPEIVSGF